MPLNQNDGVTTIESCSNVATSNPKPKVDNKSYGCNEHQCWHDMGDKSSTWGTPMSPSNVMHLHQGVTKSNLAQM